MIRIFDIILSLLAIIFFLPFFLIIIVILKFTGEGEIFYYQKRIGKEGNFFYLIKFATMLKDSPNLHTGNITSFNDPRILPFGNFLRKTKINELPQLINVLKNEMSLIGYRPLTPDIFNLYDDETKKLLINYPPGLSGMSSIFFRDEEKIFKKQQDLKDFYKTNIIPYKAYLENWYYNNINLKNYLKCNIATVIMILISNNNFYFTIFKDINYPSSALIKMFNIYEKK